MLQNSKFKETFQSWDFRNTPGAYLTAEILSNNILFVVKGSVKSIYCIVLYASTNGSKHRAVQESRTSSTIITN